MLASHCLQHNCYRVALQVSERYVRYMDIEPRQSKGIVFDDPCKRCGKTIRHDYDGLCMDCADELGVSEIFATEPEEED